MLAFLKFAKGCTFDKKTLGKEDVKSTPFNSLRQARVLASIAKFFHDNPYL
ncbi:hypothetical protein HOLleu_08670 [Holothuria leucospilota]|uniref:Uncharacterized protein n=1 Tax=Holothuria leucospilota TaxID=206669 RepID=A0A9Q1CHX3_HOLLE|nr:hypothetical protein HOLleu_08670 [Holothuria leucospilota]